MKIYTGQTKVYSIEELTEEAKEKAYIQWEESEHEYGYSYGQDENKATLDEFCKIFDINVEEWQYDEYAYSYRFNIKDSTEWEFESIENPLRLAKAIWNNYSQYIFKGKFYSGKFDMVTKRSPKRYSNTIKEISCPLTGYYMDCTILQPIDDCLHYRQSFNSYYELIDACLKSFLEACKEGYKYSLSMERFVEDAIDNEWEYLEDGSPFHSGDWIITRIEEVQEDK